MQSLKTVTGAIRDLNKVHEIADLLAPNDPGKVCSVIERKAAGWAVMDADTRLSASTAGAGKGAKMIKKVRTARRSPVNITLGALALVDTSADSHTNVRIRSPAAKAAKARKRKTREIGARSVERSRICHIGQNRVQRLLLLRKGVCPCEPLCQLGKRGGSGGDLERRLLSRWIF